MAGRVVAVIGARLNSSRLPGKQLLPLAGKPLIERLVNRLERADGIDHIMLATTADDYNKPLRDWATGYGLDCLAYAGDVNDLVGRVDTAVKQSGADHLLYVCGDSPLVEPSTISRLIAAMQANPDAGTAHLKANKPGGKFVHEGFDIYERSFWDATVAVAHEPFEREHIGAVYHHLHKVAPKAVAWVREPAVFEGVDHRVSVDTPSDYRFMRRIYEDWYAEHPADSLVDLTHVLKRVATEPGLAAINKHVHQKRVAEKNPSVAIITEIAPHIGLGHLSRSLVAAAALQDYLGAKVTLYIKGEPVEREELALIPHRWYAEEGEAGVLGRVQADVVIVDVKAHSRALDHWLHSAGKGLLRIAIDPLAGEEAAFDHVWLPSFFAAKTTRQRLNGRMSFGWDHYLIAPSHGGGQVAPEEDKIRLLVLTGGGDVAGMAGVWPELCAEKLPGNVHVNWVVGPYAAEPEIPPGLEGRCTLAHRPNGIHALAAASDVVLCVFGVSFFEALQTGKPVIVADPIGAALPEEWAALREALPGFVASSPEEAVDLLADYLGGKAAVGADIDEVRRAISQGPEKFALCVNALIAAKEGAHGRRATA